MKIPTDHPAPSPSTQLRKTIFASPLICVAVGIWAVAAQRVVGEEPLPKGPAFPVKNDKCHRFEKLRAGKIKTERGWNVADFAMSVFVKSLKEEERKALSEDVGVVAHPEPR